MVFKLLIWFNYYYFYYYQGIRLEERKKNKRFMRSVMILNIFIKIIYILNILVNPILYIWIHLYVKLFYFFRWLNWKIERYYNFRKFTHTIIMDFIMYPFLIIWWSYYKMLMRWRFTKSIDILFKRLEGTIYSILFFTSLMEFLLKFFGILNLCLIVYLVLIWMSLNKKVITKYLKIEFSLNELRQFRQKSVVLNIILDHLIDKLADLSEKTISNYYSINWYNDNILKTVNLTIHLADFNYVNKEVKYKPSFLEYKIYILNLTRIKTHIIYNKVLGYKKEENKQRVLILWKQVKRDLKKVLFKIWEIEAYLGLTEKYREEYKFVWIDRENEELIINKGIIFTWLKIEDWKIDDKEANFWEFSENLEEFLDFVFILNKEYFNKWIVEDDDLLKFEGEQQLEDYKYMLKFTAEEKKRKLEFDKAYMEEMTKFLEECKNEWEHKNIKKNE